MDELKKFGDFFDDELVEVDSIDSDEKDYPTVVGSYLPNNEPKSDEQIETAIDKLSKKYNLNNGNLSVKDVLENVDKIEDDDNSNFDLIASKLVTDYVGRIALKGAITEANMIDKVLSLMDKTPISAINENTILLLSKTMEYQDKLFQILDRYKKSGVSTTLKHLSDIRKNEKEKAENKISLTPAELKEIITAIKSGGKDEPSEL